MWHRRARCIPFAREAIRTRAKMLLGFSSSFSFGISRTHCCAPRLFLVGGRMGRRSLLFGRTTTLSLFAGNPTKHKAPSHLLFSLAGWCVRFHRQDGDRPHRARQAPHPDPGCQPQGARALPEPCTHQHTDEPPKILCTQDVVLPFFFLSIFVLLETGDTDPPPSTAARARVRLSRSHSVVTACSFLVSRARRRCLPPDGGVGEKKKKKTFLGIFFYIFIAFFLPCRAYDCNSHNSPRLVLTIYLPNVFPPFFFLPPASLRVSLFSFPQKNTDHVR